MLMMAMLMKAMLMKASIPVGDARHDALVIILEWGSEVTRRCFTPILDRIGIADPRPGNSSVENAKILRDFHE
ncbi:hypothetical protein [Robbsia andropogonis]|uniref:hypothetical protein n=2 Tax=Robbsia andropogonis TaxID=28092 RepID=UPI00209E2BDC|nr:hypothetical protein [Robbsia andropogonis]MCP1120770.1 hypothetical protein [Robbsia andropogonis]MCP1130555.1 hypothetical protein [Robbsia andropogonis]